MNPTRGRGRLESRISQSRISRVMKNIPAALYPGEVLDIGCGSYPFFLLQSPFRRKVGIDQIQPRPPPSAQKALEGLELHQLSLSGSIHLPFPEESFGCITSLACIEHLEPSSLPCLFSEIYRMLKPGGMAILTTPNAWADKPLRIMARLGLVSQEEIDEHKSLFYQRDIAALFRNAGFSPERIRVRGFQFGLNILAMAWKPDFVLARP